MKSSGFSCWAQSSFHLIQFQCWNSVFMWFHFFKRNTLFLYIIIYAKRLRFGVKKSFGTKIVGKVGKKLLWLQVFSSKMAVLQPASSTKGRQSTEKLLRKCQRIFGSTFKHYIRNSFASVSRKKRQKHHNCIIFILFAST